MQRPTGIGKIDDCETDFDDFTAAHPEGSDRNNQGAYINGFNINYPVGVYLVEGGGNQLIRNRVLDCYEGIAAFSDDFLESNFIYNCVFGMDMDYTDKYRFNTTINCATPFSLGTPLTDDNN